jgi:glycosyltransferase involved in cell wall biosynthesis
MKGMETSMAPPFISYITFNRLGLTVKNLAAILESTEDFEMHIIDSCSTDGTWDYIQSLNDSRIISKTQIGINAGQIYALNSNLIKRRPDQYFITVDNDVLIETKDWISRFMKVFETFPEVGLLGVRRGNPYPVFYPDVISKEKDGIYYLQLVHSSTDVEQDFVPGCLQCLRPELIEELGYWSEENCAGEAELSLRVNNYSSFTAGFMTDISINMLQTLDCTQCQYNSLCQLNKSTQTCFSMYKNRYKNDVFKEKEKWKFEETVKDMRSGKRPIYCASSLDGASMENHIFQIDWALENFRFYIDNANQ